MNDFEDELDELAELPDLSEAPTPTPFHGVDGPVYVDNQFGPDTLKVTRPTELCVPSVTTNALSRRPKGAR